MIEFKHLKTLQELKNTGTLSNAAAKLHQTQSALSHQFDTLEKRLGFRIFIRKSNPLKLTLQGEILLQLAEQVLPKLQKALKECQVPYQNKLRIAIEWHNCIQWMMPAINNFRQIWPQVIVDFKSGLTSNPQAALQKGELDIVLTSNIQPCSKLFYSPLFDFEVRLVLAPDHLLTKSEHIVPEDLKNEVLMIYPVQKQRLDIWRYFLKPSGVIPIFKNVDNTLLLIQMVSAKMGITALPHWVVKSFEDQGIVVTKKLGKGLWNRLYAAMRDGEQSQPILDTFVKFARQ